jgi:ankyrin repeat protein
MTMSADEEQHVQMDCFNGLYDNDLYVVQSLSRSGLVSIDATKYGCTTLHIACTSSQVGIVRESIHHNAKDELVNSKGWTALYIASSYGRVEVVHASNQHGENDTAVGNRLPTALHHALESHWGCLEIVRELLRHRQIDVNAVDSNGDTPLHIASRNGCPEIVQELVRNGALVDAQNSDGQTPLHVVCAYFSHGREEQVVKTVRELLRQGASIEATTQGGNTPLHVVSENGCLGVLQQLLAHHANVNVLNEEGETPLIVAAAVRSNNIHNIHGRLDVILELIRHNVSVYGSVIPDNAHPESPLGLTK